jgi:ABC-type dipeptide/oligopeptide/nickel transport system permease component
MMSRYIVTRFLGLILTLLTVSLFTFLAMHAAPGGPYDEEKMPLTGKQKEYILRQFGLDRPLHEQYLRFLWNALRFDFGYSYQSRAETVVQFVGRTWPPSFQLGILTLLVAMPIGLTLGTVSALYKGSWIDNLATGIVIAGISVPSYVLAIVIILVFAVALKVFPTGGWEGPKYWVMPVFVNSLGLIAIVARYTRTTVLDVLLTDYVRTAYAKGLSSRQVLLRHVLRNAIIPVLAVLGPVFPGLVTGSVFVEQIFRIPGLGRYFALSIMTRDYPVIMATVLLFTALVGVIGMFLDILYTWIDPRIRLKGDSS